MGLIFGIVMCVCVLPVMLIMFFMLYPKNWKKSRLIFGVTSRREYMEGEASENVANICSKRRGQAVKVLIVSFAAAAALFFVRSFLVLTSGWMIFMLISLIGIVLPFSLGNKEMKNLKKSLGITAENKITLTDFKNAGAIHTLKLSGVLVPCTLGLVVFIAAILVDLKVIPVNTGLAGTGVATGCFAIFFLAMLIIVLAAYMMDGMKNEVISSDSVINANYNRAKKKNLSDFIVRFLWIYCLIMGSILVFFVFFYSEIGAVICLFAYLLFLMTGIVAAVRRDRKIESRYLKEMTVTEDEDDYWLGGIFYYNPNNKRLSVKKRIGVGATINLAHPLGKVIGAVIALMLLFSLGAMVFAGIAADTPIKIETEADRLICHHLTDDYIIDYEDIESVEYGQDAGSLRFIKIAGYGMESLLKGSFSVNGEGGCKVFLNPENGNYIKIVSEGTTYYIGSATAAETEEVFAGIQSWRQKTGKKGFRENGQNT